MKHQSFGSLNAPWKECYAKVSAKEKGRRC